MFMRTIPTFSVSFAIGEDDEKNPELVELQVPADKLDTLLSILNFNEAGYYEVNKEGPWTSLSTQTESISSEDTLES